MTFHVPREARFGLRSKIGRMMNIRAKILAGCLALTTLTGLLGLYTQESERRLGRLAIDIYDNALMAVSYLRSAEVAFARLSAHAGEPGWSNAAATMSAQDMISDLDVVRDRAMTVSGRNQAIALKARIQDLLPRLRNDPKGVESVRIAFETLVENFAADAYHYRRGAERMVASEIRGSSAMIWASLLLALVIMILVRMAAAREDTERRERQAAEATNTELDRLSRNLAEALSRAEQASQAKSRFLAGVTHELRTPLHGLLGYAELLTLEGGLSPTQAERLQTMMAAGQHLLGMVNAVLDMSQIEADRLEIVPAELDLSELVRLCINVVRPTAEGRGLGLRHTAFPSVRVNADPTRLRQVMINLLGNAVKFTPAGHVEIRIRLVDNGLAARVEVADTGPGVRAIHRDKLFNTFERLNAEAVSGIEGSGLGLAISAKLVQLMGGRIGYEDNPGGGSVFWLELPACQTQARDIREMAADETRLGTAPLRILVADDEALNRSIASSFLTRAGHSFVCVENGAAAVEAALAEDFDIVLMDVRMPVMNGIEATRRIRAAAGPRRLVRIIAVTAQAFAEQIVLCEQAGMNGHLSKPFNIAMLLDALRDAGIKADVAVGGAGAACVAAPVIFRREHFADAVEFLPSEEVRDHLRTLISRCQAMAALLQAGDLTDQPEILVESAHKLAGSAGMFGLVEASEAARAVEVAATAGGDAMAPSMARLDAALKASILVLEEELAAAVA
jgi:signal transduction histidine kinase/DNA-binding response OmpR family regulator